MTPTSTGDAIPLTPTGVIIPKFARFVVHVDGLVTGSPASVPCPTGPRETVVYGPGAHTDQLGVFVDAGYIQLQTPSSSTGGAWVSDTSARDLSLIDHEYEVRVSREGFQAEISCPTPDGGIASGRLFNLSSSQTVTVEIVEQGSFDLEVRPTLAGPVPADTSIVFSFGAKTIFDDTYRTNSWKWTPDDGGPSVELFLNSCGGYACGFSPTSSGTMTLSGTVGGFLDGSRRPVSASSHVMVGTPVTVEILSAQGPNPGGSFLTRDENTIKLSARVTPQNLESQVTWVIEDSPDDEVQTIPPSTPPVGATTSFDVPIANESRARWPANHIRSLQLATKSLAYKVTATVVVGGTTYKSKSVTVKQDEFDTLRQEYIDWNKQGRAQITRAVLSSAGDAARNSGDYTVWPTSPRLQAGMPVLQALATAEFGRPLRVTGGYRNPVHHHLHGGGGPDPVPESPHLYGDATDFNIFNPPLTLTADAYFLAIRKLAFDGTVRGCFEPEHVITANGTRPLDHAHVDWRAVCPPGWGAP